MVVCDIADSPVMTFSAAVTFPYVGAIQIAAPANAVRFRKPRRLISLFCSVFMSVILFIIGYLSIRL